MAKITVSSLVSQCLANQGFSTLATVCAVTVDTALQDSGYPSALMSAAKVQNMGDKNEKSLKTWANYVSVCRALLPVMAKQFAIDPDIQDAASWLKAELVKGKYSINNIDEIGRFAKGLPHKARTTAKPAAPVAAPVTVAAPVAATVPEAPTAPDAPTAPATGEQATPVTVLMSYSSDGVLTLADTLEADMLRDIIAVLQAELAKLTATV